MYEKIVKRSNEKVPCVRSVSNEANVNIAGSVESHWHLPTENRIKLNTDGACRHVNGYAACGGVARDSLCSWDAGFRHMELEVDSLEALRVLCNDYCVIHRLHWHLAELRERDWVVKVQHVRRGGNMVAEALAKCAADDSLIPIIHHELPSFVLPLLLANAS
ncbi:uncharacterized protein LOC120164612 [Hibiscus syriacus]|uniref:uncharacterized protein LOC120164612 n=1 Tax=Hibiscus syriacus TaxID=106335 RepID=UPI0019208E81|nr:uncharacterized protein LOC120164612 [Hibiscus syriacus]